MLTAKQIRAARALLDWNQEDLAKRADVTEATIRNIEKGHNTPNAKTLVAIQSVFERENIAFIGETGVEIRQREIVTYKGIHGFVSFIDDIFDTVKRQGGDISLCNANDEQFMRWASLANIAESHIERMAKLKKEVDYRFRVLVGADGKSTISSSYAEYRKIKDENFGLVPFYAYGDKLAIITFGETLKIHALQEKEIAGAFHIQFNELWKKSEKI